MNPIRPSFHAPVPTARPVRPDVRAAQKAFFQASVVAPAAPGRPEPVTSVAPAARSTADGETTPQRYLRPGSLLDIKV